MLRNLLNASEHLAGWSFHALKASSPYLSWPSPAIMVARVAERAHDASPVFARGFFAARQIDDERVAALCGDGARQHRVRRDLQAVITHGLGNAGNLAVASIARGFRCDIARRKAASAAGEHDIGANFIAGFENAARDKHAVVLDDNVANLPAFFLN